MAKQRFQALQEVDRRKPLAVELPSEKVSNYFASKVFTWKQMREYLSAEVYATLRNCVDKGGQIDRTTADQVASSMKSWALQLGATHYTHWFQPLTGSTAEKHDAFFEPLADGFSMESFGGDKLVQQEPDASSFPSGGIRNTFEARGYTAWDPSSPAFVIGRTLCIPTVFVAYTGESLDHKAPLLRSVHFLDRAATTVVQEYFDRNVSRVICTLGCEQEYFLVDRALFNARPDLALTGRTLFGHSSAKDQQLEDHYFGSINDRVTAYMRDFETEALKLGIPVKTRHNEVGPGQFECAPVYEEVSLAVDHNQLLMDIMEKVAFRHDFRVLFHEKPFAGINGSGKHNNWALATDTGKNLLSPGKTPKKNIQFLTFFITTIRAVCEHADLLRASIASASNDHRLGANEAPPAIVSVFIGSFLTQVLDDIEEWVKKGKQLSPDEKTELKLNVIKIPEILLDNTDRNRTSPFAFTGNKFEFRAVGSSANCSTAMMVLNTIVADQLVKFHEEVQGLVVKGMKKDDAIFQVLRKYIAESKKIRFEGNGYGEEWVKEAEKRGLSNVKTTPEALDFIMTSQSKDLFSKNEILSERELEARYEIDLERYTKKIQIESRVMGDLAINHIIPTAVEYQNLLITNVTGLKQVLSAKEFDLLASEQMSLIREISERMTALRKLVGEMTEERKQANRQSSARKQADDYCVKVLPYFERIRREVDKLELIISDEYWPLPKYRELLFNR
ncbi:MAG: glutamine synthetase type III [Flavobacteriales bacterium]|nr:glutamine synthetase type III [Flavobacteriales bacterium]